MKELTPHRGYNFNSRKKHQKEYLKAFPIGAGDSGGRALIAQWKEGGRDKAGAEITMAGAWQLLATAQKPRRSSTEAWQSP